MDIDFWSEAYDELRAIEEEPNLSLNTRLKIVEIKALLSISQEVSCIARDELPALTADLNGNFKKLRELIENMPDRMGT